MSKDIPRSAQMREYCQRALETSHKVFKTIDTPSLTIQTADTVFCIHVNTQEIADALFPPLRHLIVETLQDNPVIHIYAWDQETANTSLSTLSIYSSFQQPSNPHDGETIYFSEAEWNLAYQAPRHHISLANISTNEAVFCIPQLKYLFPVDGRPFRAIFQWFLNQKDHQIVHAAGIGIPNGGVIVTGKSGSGKSTTAAACLNSELQFAGDENVIVSTSSAPKVHSLYNSANLDEKSLSLMPYLNIIRTSAKFIQADKLLYNLYEIFPERMIRAFALKAIIVTKVAGSGDHQLKPISSAIALTALAPTSMFQIPNNKRESFIRMSELVKKIPTYQLTLGTPMQEVPFLISQFLNKLINGY